MGYYERPRSRMGVKIAGLIIVATTLIIAAFYISIGFTVLGAVFTGFDPLAAGLASAPLAVYQTLRSTTLSIFEVFVVVIPLSVIGIIISAIYSLRNPGDEG